MDNSNVAVAAVVMSLVVVLVVEVVVLEGVMVVCVWGRGGENYKILRRMYVVGVTGRTTGGYGRTVEGGGDVTNVSVRCLYCMSVIREPTCSPPPPTAPTNLSSGMRRESASIHCR